MCFFDQHRFSCGDWKWGHFRQHCAKGYRIGETCGVKLVMETIPVGSKCRLCEKIDTKTRRREAEKDRVERWQRDTSRFGASIAKSTDTIRNLDREIRDLTIERDQRLQSIGHGKFAASASESSQIVPQTCAPPSDQYELIKKAEVACGLPISFGTRFGYATVMGVPDSGSDMNCISLDLANHLGFKLLRDESEQEEVTLIDGTSIPILGLVKAVCRFGKTFYNEPKDLFCSFLVLANLVSPLIISDSFLQETETFTRHRSRLVNFPCLLRAPRIRALGHAKRKLKCSINGEDAIALADSGSDVDLVSWNYVSNRDYIRPTEQDLFLADGRILKPIGIYDAQLCIGTNGQIVKIDTVEINSLNAIEELDLTDERSDCSEEHDAVPPPSPSRSVRHVIETRFFVIEKMEYDILIGAGSLETLRVFSDHIDAFFTSDVQSDTCSGLHRIGLREKARIALKKIPRAMLNAPDTDNRQDTRLLDDADQHENARREAANILSETLSGQEKVQFEADEQQRRREFREYREHILASLSPS